MDEIQKHINAVDTAHIQKRINAVDEAHAHLSRCIGAHDMDVEWLMQVMVTRREFLMQQKNKAQLQVAIDLMLPHVVLDGITCPGAHVESYASTSCDTQVEVKLDIFNVDALKALGFDDPDAFSFMGLPVRATMLVPATWLTCGVARIASDIDKYRTQHNALVEELTRAELEVTDKQDALSKADDALACARAARDSFTFAQMGTL